MKEKRMNTVCYMTKKNRYSLLYDKNVRFKSDMKEKRMNTVCYMTKIIDVVCYMTKTFDSNLT